MSRKGTGRHGPGFDLQLSGGVVTLRLWWRNGTLDPVTWRDADRALADLIAEGLASYIHIDLREAPPVASRRIRTWLEAFLRRAAEAGLPITIWCGSTSIQRRDLAELAAQTAPSACIRFPAAALPPLAA